jgi:hypothetical protein
LPTADEGAGEALEQIVNQRLQQGLKDVLLRGERIKEKGEFELLVDRGSSQGEAVALDSEAVGLRSHFVRQQGPYSDSSRNLLF